MSKNSASGASAHQPLGAVDDMHHLLKDSASAPAAQKADLVADSHAKRKSASESVFGCVPAPTRGGRGVGRDLPRGWDEAGRGKGMVVCAWTTESTKGSASRSRQRGEEGLGREDEQFRLRLVARAAAKDRARASCCRND
eukprot:2244727-Pleurochrysis_carterae.AAC.2